MDNISANKKAYLDYKEKLLADIEYYEKSIENFRTNDKNNNFYDDFSSDSEDDWLPGIDITPKAVELKQEQSRLRTYLQATQELTGLTVLQFEVNMLVQAPKIDGEPPVREGAAAAAAAAAAGRWREVAAECRAGLVPFSITFFVHTPDRKFSQPSYRGVRVGLVKATHEAELANTVLHTLTTPSDAVEVLRSYAASYRSRRTTLARLANKYTSALLMEPHSEGGFVLKCANLLEVIWRLENKGSPIAPFHHKMKFDLEYMDESYIKVISQCHKQLADPSIQTDERTLILAKIITTCLEAKGVDPNEAAESDLNPKTKDFDLKKDSEVMAPPKSLPKKAKTKSKNAQKKSNDNDGSKLMRTNDNDENDENAKNVSNTAQKRSVNSNSNDGSKKMKNNDKGDGSSKNLPNTGQKSSISVGSKRMKSNVNNENAETNENAANLPNGSQKRCINDNVSEGSKRMKSNDNIKNTKTTGNIEVPKVIQNTNNNTENINNEGKTKTDKMKKSVATAKNEVPKTAVVNENNIVANAKNVNTNKNKAISTKISTNTKEVKNVSDNNNAHAKNKSDKDKAKAKNDAPAKNLVNSAVAKTAAGQITNIEGAHTKNKVTKHKNNINSVSNNKIKNSTDTKKINKIDDNGKTNNKDKIIINSGVVTKHAEKLAQNTNANTKNAIAKTKNLATNNNLVENTKHIANNPKSAMREDNDENLAKNIAKSTVKKATEKNMATTKNRDKIADRTTNRNSDKNINDKPSSNTKLEKIISGNLNNKISNNIISLKTGNIKPNQIFKSGNNDKENGKVSKIPQKKLTPISEKSMKSNPSRISPRSFPSKFKTQITKKNIIQVTSIPRLLKKSVPK